MKYVGTVFKNVIVSKGINYTEFIDENEIELTEEQYNTIQTPCQLVDGEFVQCEHPESEEELKAEAQITEMEQLRADVDYIAIMTGVEL